MRENKAWRGNVRATVIEVGLIGLFCLLVLFWVIPAETSGTGSGLDPDTMPTVTIIALLATAVAGAVIRILHNGKGSEQAGLGLAPLFVHGGICATGGALLGLLGPLACTLFTLPALMIALGERRWVRILATTAVGAAATYLTFGEGL
ncbi:MAG: tripartite tricarboxylate transporter TctB family protein [Parvibaculaceae bacterium]